MSKSQDLEGALLNLLACPRCGSKLVYGPNPTKACCQLCQSVYNRENGIWQMLTPIQLEQYQPFIKSYRALRHDEGWERETPDYYLNLPEVKADDSQAAIWRIRQRSLRTVKQLVGRGEGRWALDLGAGNGWLSRQLKGCGFQVVALDICVTGADSLEGAELYQQHDHIWFGRVQASMEYLPFQAETFDLAVASGSLHYVNLELTLAAIWRILQPGGRFVLTDSPVYSQSTAGQAMIAEYTELVTTRFGHEPHWVGGTGFMVEQTLLAGLQQQGFEIKTYSIERMLGKIKRLALSPLKKIQHRREEAHFPVIVARKPA